MYSIHDRTQFEVNMTMDWQPVQCHQAWRDVVANVPLTAVSVTTVTGHCSNGNGKCEFI